MNTIVYVSSAVNPFSKGDLTTLLEKSRENNAAMKITGMLLYKDGNFMQALEGDDNDVGTLREKIERDPRHRGFIQILSKSISERAFADWSMGFHDLRSPEANQTAGYSDFLRTPLTGAEFSSNPSRCQKLLLCFKKGM
jgi:hypothetical protein